MRGEDIPVCVQSFLKRVPQRRPFTVCVQNYISVRRTQWQVLQFSHPNSAKTIMDNKVFELFLTYMKHRKTVPISDYA